MLIPISIIMTLRRPRYSYTHLSVQYSNTYSHPEQFELDFRERTSMHSYYVSAKSLSFNTFFSTTNP